MAAMHSANYSRTHSRNTSHGTSCSSSSYQQMLEQQLSNPINHEMPLRHMYAINCTRGATAAPLPPAPRTRSGSNSPSTGSPNSPNAPTAPWQETQATTAQFTSNLTRQISQMPSQPSSLPPSFTTLFLRRVFGRELVDVEFHQSLTALDYLKDLETRRRKEILAALQRLDMDAGSAHGRASDVTAQYPEVAKWLTHVTEMEDRLDALYAQLYIGFRRWVMINELKVEPFSKHNCLAMLNTLYPPVPASEPPQRVTLPMLQSQREKFFKYTQQVERHGTTVLENVIRSNKRDGEENGWPVVREALEKYLDIANSVIKECSSVQSLSDLVEDLEARRRKKDSGVSFGSSGSNSTGDRPSTAGSTSTNGRDKPLPMPPSPSKSPRKMRKFNWSFGKKKSAKAAAPIAPTADVDDVIRPDTASIAPQRPALRKIRSLGDLKSRNLSMTSLIGGPTVVETPVFDAEEMKRHREAYEAKIFNR